MTIFLPKMSDKYFKKNCFFTGLKNYQYRFMKNIIFILLAFVCLATITNAQSPEAINYQAVLRNNSGLIVQNETVTIQFEIIDGNNSSVYTEEQTLSTNDYGLVNVKIGEGTPINGVFSNIDWGASTYNLKIRIDLGNGLVDFGESQLVSVPYALHAKTAENAFSGNWSDLDGVPADLNDGDDTGITSESDPVFSNSPAANISNANIADWSNDLDGDTTNELQLLSISNDTVFLSRGQFVKLPADIGEFLRTNGAVHNTSDLVNDNFVFGSMTLDNISGIDDNKRFFFNKELGAFRAGGTDTVLWDFDSLGTYSIGLGRNNIAKGYAAFASGWGTKAYGNHSSALGYFNQAIGATSTALGRLNIARGDRSTSLGWGTESDGSTSVAAGYFCKSIGSISIAMGHLSESRGLHSVAIGDAAIADGAKSVAIGSNLSTPSYGEFSVGIFNTSYTANSTTAFDNADRIFTVGNGVNGANRSNALTILKSGNTGVGVDVPERSLHISDVMRIEPTSTAPANPSEGDIYMDSSTHKLMVFDGSVWQACW